MRSIIEDNDPVNYYLREQGYAMRPAYIEHTAFIRGWQINNAYFSVIYKFDDNILLICEIKALHQAKGLETALKGLMRLFLGLLDNVVAVKQIRGLIINYGEPQDLNLRNKMVKMLLIKHNAIVEESFDQRWIVLNK